MKVPDEAIEAAARSIWSDRFLLDWSYMSDYFHGVYLREAKAALEAAAPLIEQEIYRTVNLLPVAVARYQAQALRDARDEFDPYGSADDSTRAGWVRNWLTDRADALAPQDTDDERGTA